jgi:hypothetical protein
MIVLGTAALVFVSRSNSETIATVNGSPISRAMFDEYAAVFANPDGSLRIPREDVLVSVINQMLVQREANRLGITVPETELAHALEGMADSDLGGTLPKGGEVPAFRERVRLFLLFKIMKERVVGPFEVPIEQIQAAYEAEPALHVLGFEGASQVLVKRIREHELESRWSDWLRRERACADIRVMDASFGIPTASPGAVCLVQVTA